MVATNSLRLALSLSPQHAADFGARDQESGVGVPQVPDRDQLVSSKVDALLVFISLMPDSPTQPMSPAMAATTAKLDSSFVPIFKSWNHFNSAPSSC